MKRGKLMLEIGTLAPEFTLPDQNGEMHSLKDYRRKRVILDIGTMYLYMDA